MVVPFSLMIPDPVEWAEVNFAGARMGNKRRKARLKSVACAMAAQPGRTIPQMMNSRQEIKAAYKFFDRPEADPDRIQAGHRKATMDQAKRADWVVLFIEDNTELSGSGNEPAPGLGPIGSFREGLQGFMLQSVVALEWPGVEGKPEQARRPALRVLGLADQQYHLRKRRPVSRRIKDPRAHGVAQLESHRWDRSLERLGPVPPGKRWVRVADRGADIYEFMEGSLRQGWAFVVRAAHDRILVGADGAKKESKLFEAARRAQGLGGLTLELRARPGQKARVASLRVSAARVLIRSAKRPGHAAGTLPSIDCTVVRLFEPHPPPGAKALEWLLLTDAKVEDQGQALEVAGRYAARWVIEDFHKALKTGLGAERLQLERAHRLLAAISIMSVTALRLVDLRERVRLTPQAPAEESGLGREELKVLRAHLKRPVITMADLGLAIGRLGGHMNRLSADRQARATGRPDGKPSGSA